MIRKRQLSVSLLWNQSSTIISFHENNLNHQEQSILGGLIDVVYLDFSKAFDKVPKCCLLYKLQHLDLRGGLIKWTDSFQSEMDLLEKPVLGLLLFIAYRTDIKSILASRFAMFADENKMCQNKVI